MSFLGKPLASAPMLVRTLLGWPKRAANRVTPTWLTNGKPLKRHLFLEILIVNMIMLASWRLVTEPDSWPEILVFVGSMIPLGVAILIFLQTLNLDGRD